MYTRNVFTEKEIVLQKKIKKSLTTKKSTIPKTKSNAKKPPAKGSSLPFFCTQCDKELDIFWLKDMASDKKAVKMNFENCKKTGKIKGHYCSKMFISGAYSEKVLKKKK
ncbi:MAG TPA: hypothetical protein VIL99_07900 [Ignavibacteria bacterium]